MTFNAIILLLLFGVLHFTHMLGKTSLRRRTLSVTVYQQSSPRKKLPGNVKRVVRVAFRLRINNKHHVLCFPYFFLVYQTGNSSIYPKPLCVCNKPDVGIN